MDQPQLRKEDRHRAEQPLAAAQMQTRAAPGRPASRLQSSIHRGGCGSGRIHLHCQPREASRRLPGEAEPWAKPSAGAGGGGSAVRAGSHTAESLPAPGAPTGGRPSRCKALGPPPTQKKVKKKKKSTWPPRPLLGGGAGWREPWRAGGQSPPFQHPSPAGRGAAAGRPRPKANPAPGTPTGPPPGRRAGPGAAPPHPAPRGAPPRDRARP